MGCTSDTVPEWPGEAEQLGEWFNSPSEAQAQNNLQVLRSIQAQYGLADVLSYPDSAIASGIGLCHAFYSGGTYRS